MQNLAAKTFCGGEGERVAATDAAGTVPSCCERTSDHMQYKVFFSRPARLRMMSRRHSPPRKPATVTTGSGACGMWSMHFIGTCTEN